MAAAFLFYALRDEHVFRPVAAIVIIAVGAAMLSGVVVHSRLWSAAAIVPAGSPPRDTRDIRFSGGPGHPDLGTELQVRRLTDVHKAPDVADHAYVLRRGEISLSGTAADLRSRFDQVERSYLVGDLDDVTA